MGLSLREVGRALDDPGFTPSELVDDLIRQTRERIAGETELLTRLRRIGAAEPADWQDVLQTVVLLQDALAGCLARDAIASSARRRLTQALADTPGATASRALAELSNDEDRIVAHTAAYVLQLRNGR
ncbi:hypothetical protein ACFQE5_18370 [Pseudonocardia hispaniensis]|uniref:MerR-like DNA binding protein n=1 Tax=Pseudonocardia hispaniensis TaxID=904933 RepID=A0ABW1J5R0_9PSEU